MDLFVAFIVATVAWIITPLWEVPVSYVAERVFTRSRLDVGRQLQGLTFSLLTAPFSAVTFEGASWVIRKTYMPVLFDFSRFAWTAAHPVAAMWTAAALAMIVGDFFYYWTHRLQHAVPLFWRFHSQHHSIHDLSALNNYAHWSEEAVGIAFRILPVTLLIAGGGHAGTILAAVLMVHQRYIHSTSRLHFGRWSWLINDNRRHRIHHSLEPHHFDRNFSITFGFWDHLFGTAYVPAKGEWPDTGLTDRPEAQNIADFLLWSFRSVEDPLLASAPGVRRRPSELLHPGPGREVEIVERKAGPGV